MKGDGLYEAWLNLKFSAFHEGRGAGKADPPGGHDLVNGKNSYAVGKVRKEKACFLRQNCPSSRLVPVKQLGTWMFSKVENFVVAMCHQPLYGQPTNKPRGLDGRSQSSLSQRYLSQSSAVWLEAEKEVVIHKTPILSAG